LPITELEQAKNIVRRIIILVIAGLALVWMVFPQIQWQGTEMGFVQGTPDPNIYRTTYLPGWPLPWIAWEQSWNEAAAYSETDIHSFRLLSFTVHLLAILLPSLELYRMSRSARMSLTSGD
jgi:hypothetical protein